MSTTTDGLRALPGLIKRLASLERTNAEMQARLAALEADSAALEEVRDQVRSLTVQLTEQLNDVSAALADQPLQH